MRKFKLISEEEIVNLGMRNSLTIICTEKPEKGAVFDPYGFCLSGHAIGWKFNVPIGEKHFIVQPRGMPRTQDQVAWISELYTEGVTERVRLEKLLVEGFYFGYDYALARWDDGKFHYDSLRLCKPLSFQDYLEHFSDPVDGETRRALQKNVDQQRRRLRVLYARIRILEFYEGWWGLSNG